MNYLTSQLDFTISRCSYHKVSLFDLEINGILFFLAIVVTLKFKIVLLSFRMLIVDYCQGADTVGGGGITPFLLS